MIDRDEALIKVTAALANDPLRQTADMTRDQFALDCKVFALQIVDAIMGLDNQITDEMVWRAWSHWRFSSMPSGADRMREALKVAVGEKIEAV